MKERYAALVAAVREKKPLVHHITNYVTVHDCANITLAIGASPIMADAIGEAEEIAAISASLVLNLGTLNERTIASMLAAGRAANEAGVPVTLDPVGAGASRLRNETVALLLEAVRVTALRGNISEIRFIAGLSAQTKGVDAADSDLAAGEDARDIAEKLAGKLGCVVAITGAVDVVSDGEKTVCIENGHPMMSSLTGTGCMCSSLAGAFLGASPDCPFDAAVAALLCMGIAGEIAHEKAGNLGNGSFHAALLDAVSRLDGETLAGRAKLYEA